MGRWRLLSCRLFCCCPLILLIHIKDYKDDRDLDIVAFTAITGNKTRRERGLIFPSIKTTIVYIVKSKSIWRLIFCNLDQPIPYFLNLYIKSIGHMKESLRIAIAASPGSRHQQRADQHRDPDRV